MLETDESGGNECVMVEVESVDEYVGWEVMVEKNEI